MRIKFMCLFLVIGGLNLLCAIDVNESANEILIKVDERRSISESFKFLIKIEDYTKDGIVQTARMTGYVKGFNKTMVQYDEPLNMKGKKLLMVDDEFSIFVPNTQRPVRLTPSQRLMGQASNGDVMNVRFQRDYKPLVTGEEMLTVDDMTKDCLILELTACRSSSAYSRIVLWAEKDSFYPVKADFYALSGKKLKTAEYSFVKEFGGRKVISKTVLYDLIITENKTVIEFIDMEKEIVPDKYFVKEFLLRM